MPRSSRALGPATWAFACLAAIACGGSSGETPTTPLPPDAGELNLCPEGMKRDGDVCVEIAAASCAPGSIAFAGDPACAPLAIECPQELFDRDPSGWGCRDRPAPSACTGMTREEVGSPRCVPIGDCAAPFPPAGAIVVDDDFTAGQLDATHFRTIGEAVAAAPSGATIAIEGGVYPESVSVARPVTLVGRCPERVILRGDGQNPGVRVRAISGVTVRGVSLAGYARAVDVGAGSEVTVEDTVVTESVGSGLFVDASRLTVRRSRIASTRVAADGRSGWNLAAGGGSTLDVEASAIVAGVEGLFAASKGTVVKVRESVFARQAPEGTRARASGLLAATGARVELSRSVVRDLAGDGAVKAEEDGVVEVRESVLRDVRVDGSQARGHGAVAIAGGKIVLLGVTLLRAESIGLSSQGTGSRIEARGLALRGPVASNARVTEDLRVESERAGFALQAIDRGSALLDGAALLDTWGFAAYVQAGGSLEAKGTYVEAVRPLRSSAGLGFGVAVTVNGEGTKAKLDRFTVTGGTLAAISAGNKGVIEGDRVLLRDVGEVAALGTGAGLSVGTGGKATLDRSAIVGAAGVGVLAVRGAGAGVTLTRTVIRGTKVAQLGFGHAVAIGVDTTARLDRSFVLGSGATGLAVAGGAAVIARTTFGSNPVALHVQDGSFLVESDDGEGSPQVGEVRVSSDTTFTANGSRVGSGVVALPRSVLE